MFSCSNQVNERYSSETDKLNIQNTYEIRLLDRFGDFILLKNNMLPSPVFYHLYRNEFLSARNQLLTFENKNRSEFLIAAGEFFYRRAELTREIVHLTASMICANYEIRQKSSIKTDLEEKLSLWEIGEAYLHIKQKNNGLEILNMELKRNHESKSATDFYTLMAEQLQYSEDVDIEKILYDRFTAQTSGIYNIKPDLLSHFKYLISFFSSQDSDIDAYLKSDFPKRTFPQIKDDVSWFPVLRLQVLCDYYASGLAFEKVLDNDGMNDEMRSFAAMKSGMAFLNSFNINEAKKSFSRSSHPLAKWYLSRLTDLSYNGVIIPLEDEALETKRFIFEDYLFFRFLGVNQMDEFINTILNDIETGNEMLDPISNELWFFYRQRLISLLLKLNFSLDELNISSEFQDNPSIQTQYHDLLFLLRYVEKIFSRGFSRYSEINGILNSMYEHLAVGDTLLINFLNIYADEARGSGGVYIR